jgi:hypothetical protein
MRILIVVFILFRFPFDDVADIQSGDQSESGSGGTSEYLQETSADISKVGKAQGFKDRADDEQNGKRSFGIDVKDAV